MGEKPSMCPLWPFQTILTFLDLSRILFCKPHDSYIFRWVCLQGASFILGTPLSMQLKTSPWSEECWQHSHLHKTQGVLPTGCSQPFVLVLWKGSHWLHCLAAQLYCKAVQVVLYNWASSTFSSSQGWEWILNCCTCRKLQWIFSCSFLQCWSLIQTR